MVKLVYFAHCVVEDAGDDAAVGVAGWSGIALAQAKFADKGLAFFVEDEFQAHAVAVIHAADEAVVLLHFCVAGVVALGLGWHAGIVTGRLGSIEFVRVSAPCKKLHKATDQYAETCDYNHVSSSNPHFFCDFDQHFYIFLMTF
jgi:hypothetical protein